MFHENPIAHYPKGVTIATASFKRVKLGGGFGSNWIFGNPEALVSAAVTGVFTPTALGSLEPTAGQRQGLPALRRAGAIHVLARRGVRERPRPRIDLFDKGSPEDEHD